MELESFRGDPEQSRIALELQFGESAVDEGGDERILGGNERVLSLQKVSHLGTPRLEIELDGGDPGTGHVEGEGLNSDGLPHFGKGSESVPDLGFDPVLRLFILTLRPVKGHQAFPILIPGGGPFPRSLVTQADRPTVSAHVERKFPGGRPIGSLRPVAGRDVAFECQSGPQSILREPDGPTGILNGIRDILEVQPMLERQPDRLRFGRRRKGWRLGCLLGSQSGQFGFTKSKAGIGGKTKGNFKSVQTAFKALPNRVEPAFGAQEILPSLVHVKVGDPTGFCQFDGPGMGLAHPLEIRRRVSNGLTLLEHRKVFGDKADSKLLLEPFKAPEGIEKPALHLGQRFPGYGTSGATQQRNGYAGVQGDPERGGAASGEEAGDVQSQMGGQRGTSLQLPGQRDTGLGRPFERFDALSPLPGQKGIDRPGQRVMKGIGFPIESQSGGKDALLLVLILPTVERRNLKRLGQGDLHGFGSEGRRSGRNFIAGRERLFKDQAAAQGV